MTTMSMSVQSALEPVVTLRNGASIRLRPIRPDDEPRLMALCRRLSPRPGVPAILLLSPAPSRGGARLRQRRLSRAMAVVAEVDTGQEPQLIGVARYGPSDEETIADIALVVEDGWQGLGLGPILLEEILRAGEQRGICRFRADVLTENRRADDSLLSSAS